MNRKNRLILRLDGPDRHERRLELPVFVKKTSQFLNLLKSSVKESGKDSAVFHVVGLSYASPATIECEPANQTPLAARASCNSVRNALDCVVKKQANQLSHPVLSCMEELADYDRNKITRIKIYATKDDGTEFVYNLNEDFRKGLIEARRTEDVIISTIDGNLEQINIHNKANTFRIYSPVALRPPVACKFHDNLIKDIQHALGRCVSVRGKCFYRPDAAFPYRMDVQEITVLPLTEGLPTLSDLRGIAPGATGEKSSEQFVRELRSQWDKSTQ